MNTGIQDAANLAWKMAAVARYEEERGEVGRALLRFTERGLRMATISNPLVEGVRDLFAPFLTGLRPVQRALLGFIAETGIEYRSSLIVWDHGGDGELRAGDRLPDLTLLNPSDETTLLRNWTASKHLALVINGCDAEITQVRSDLGEADVVCLYTPQLDDEGIRLLGIKKKVIIVRPDGYVGFRAPLSQHKERRAYAQQDGLIRQVVSLAA